MTWVVDCENRKEAVNKAYGFAQCFSDEIYNVKVHYESNGDLCVMEYTTDTDDKVMIFDRKKEITVQKTWEDGAEEEITVYIVKNLGGEVYFPFSETI